jgi:GNAT superfamily N-acetyltransferase
VARSIEHSLVFGSLRDGKQVAFARVVTDRATFAYLCDVFVLEDAQGRGIGTQLVQAVMAHQTSGPAALPARDARRASVYARFGFAPLAQPERHMERVESQLIPRVATGFARLVSNGLVE